MHTALPKALRLLELHGYSRGSRNGMVRVLPCPVATTYEQPCERVLFWPERDANPFFHLYESLWMLAGRNDLAPLLRYVKDFGRFSDDGTTLHGAYGKRWRDWFDTKDQLAIVAERLSTNGDDRRCVVTMWDADLDLGFDAKDVPCNLIATFQRGAHGELNLTVFCRSNDVVWGCYGANAVHFSFLLEYMAAWIDCPVGTYTQVSVNWHAYEKTLGPVAALAKEGLNFSQPMELPNPYLGQVRALPLVRPQPGEQPGDTIKRLDRYILSLLGAADSDFDVHPEGEEPFFVAAYHVLKAHRWWRTVEAPTNFLCAEQELALADQTVDWVVAAQQWVARRKAKWAVKMTTKAMS